MIIAYAGDSKSCFFEAMDAAKSGDFNLANELMKKGSESLQLAHSEHSKLITSEARGEDVNITLLLIHASSTFTGAELSMNFAEQFIQLCQEMKKK